MKALILAAGRGSRMGDIGGDNKCLLELKDGLCALDYNLKRAVEIEPDEIIIVVGHQANKIIDKYGPSVQNIPISYVTQHEPKGLVHAIECAKEQIGKSSFFLFLGDEVLINSRHKELVNDYRDMEISYFVLGVLTDESRSDEEISKTYTVRTCNGVVLRAIEKPAYIYEGIQGTGHCVCSNDVFDYFKCTPTTTRRGHDEKEFPDLIQSFIDVGGLVDMFDICDDYININEISDIEKARKMLQD